MEGRVIARKYELRREIGRGGMGSVWEALDLDLDRVVALKLIVGKHALSADYKRRFQAEARALAQLKTDYVVDVYDFGFDEGSPYIAMEHLAGETLDALLAREQRLSLDQTLELARQIGAGLSAAAAQDIVHRDLKPANVFITPSETGYRAKLLDFGVAWAKHETGLESEGGPKLIGTPIYMSPEQIRGEPPHRLSDHWSLAVLLYRALVGELPFQSKSIGELIVGICTDPFPPATSLCPDLPDRLDDFFERALAKNAADRFQTPRELVDALAEVCSQSSSTKVLIVDDEEDMPALMKMKFRRELKKNTYEFVYADNGKTALEALDRHADVDIILSDINMPVMDGLSLLDRVTRERPLIRTIMVSAYGNMENIRQAMNAGAFDFVTKPVDFKDLKKTLQKTLADVHERRALTSSGRENQTLRRYVSATVANRLGDDIGAGLAFTNEKRRASVMSIRPSELSLTQSRSPTAEIARFLNARYEVIIPAIEAREGIIDRLHGSGLVAVFVGPDHLTRALVTAMRLQAQFAKLANIAGSSSPYAERPRIGLATGEVLWTNTGSRVYQRMSYGAIGEPVNRAERLADCASAGEVLIGDDIRTHAPWSLSLAPLELRSIAPWTHAFSLLDDNRIEESQGDDETIRSMAMTELSVPMAAHPPKPSEVETETLHDTELSSPKLPRNLQPPQ